MVKRFLERIYWIKICGKSESEMIIHKYKKMGVSIGSNVHIYGGWLDKRYDPLIEIGNNVTLSNTTILAHDASTQKFCGYTKFGKVKIKNNVYVGYASIILPGTIIEDNVIIGGGTVVRGHIEADSVYMGNPAIKLCSCSEYLARQKAYKENDFVLEDLSISELCRMAESNRIYGIN